MIEPCVFFSLEESGLQVVLDASKLSIEPFKGRAG